MTAGSGVLDGSVVRDLAVRGDQVLNGQGMDVALAEYTAVVSELVADDRKVVASHGGRRIDIEAARRIF